MRLLYSIAMAPLFGVLDGLALRRLAEVGRPAELYGQERLYGAYGWAVSSLLFGICSDAVPGGLFGGVPFHQRRCRGGARDDGFILRGEAGRGGG